jgi:hypothetical protein
MITAGRIKGTWDPRLYDVARLLGKFRIGFVKHERTTS